MQTKLFLLVTVIVTSHAFCFGRNRVDIISDTTGYSAYAGSYRYPEASPVPYINIVFKDGKLFASAEGFPETQLYLKEKDVFFDSTYGAEFAFFRSGNSVDTVKVDVNGAVLLGVRMKDDRLGSNELDVYKNRPVLVMAMGTRRNYRPLPPVIM